MIVYRIEKEVMQMLQGTGIREKVLEEICALAEKYRLDRVILFGSRARGDYKKTSDIDLAASGGMWSAFLWMWRKKPLPCYFMMW